MYKKKILIASILIVIAIVAFNIMGNKKVSENTKVALETTQGTIVIELYTGQMPITAGNLIKLDYNTGKIFMIGYTAAK